MDESEYAMPDGNGQIQINEPRFIDDDLLKLCDLGLLRLSRNSSGGRIFTITRAGAVVGGLARRVLPLLGIRRHGSESEEAKP